MSYFPVGQLTTLATTTLATKTLALPDVKDVTFEQAQAMTASQRRALCPEEGTTLVIDRSRTRDGKPMVKCGSVSVKIRRAPFGSKNYFLLLLKAQGSKEGRKAADAENVEWRIPTGVGGKPRIPHTKPFPPGYNFDMAATMMVADHKKDPGSKLSWAIRAWEARDKAKKQSPKSIAEHRAQVIMANCASVGVPEHLLECCAMDMQRRGMTPERYMEMINENDPIVMACLAPADQAHKDAKRRKLIMISAVAAAGAVGLSLVMKKRKKS